MTATLVKADSPGSLAPNISEVIEQVDELVSSQRDDLLKEGRIQAEAQSLYLQRAGNRDAANAFLRVKILAEAALGVLSFDDSSIIDKDHYRKTFRELAAGYERGCLLDICDEVEASDGTLSSSVVASKIVSAGYTYVSSNSLRGLDGKKQSLRWSDARKRLIESGQPLQSVPPDHEHQRVLAGRRARHRELHDAREQQIRIKERRLIQTAARSAGPKIERAYGLLRQLAQAIDQSRDELDTPWRQRDIDDALENLYYVEESIAHALGLRGSDEKQS